MTASVLVSDPCSDKKDLSLLLGGGPCFLMCASSLVLFHGEGFLALFPPIVAGSLLCFKMRMRGFLYSLLILVLGAMTNHLVFTTHHLWHLGVEASIGMGLFLSAAVSRLLFERNTLSREKETAQQQTIHHLEEELSRLQKEALEAETTLRDRLAALQEEREEMSGDLDALTILNEVVRKTSAKQEEELDTVKQRLLSLQNMLKERETLITELLSIRHLYLQLKKQYEERNHVLHLTRRELFAAETTLQRLSLERIENERSPPAQLSLERALVLIERDCSSLEEENQHLIELISLLCKKSRPPRAKRAAPIEEPALFQELRC